MSEELREKIAKRMAEEDGLDWEELDGEDARDYMKKAGIAIRVMAEEGLGYVDWGAKMPENPFREGRFTSIARKGYQRAIEDMVGWRPVRRLE